MCKTTALQFFILFRVFPWFLLHDYDLKTPKATIYGGGGEQFSFFFPYLFVPISVIVNTDSLLNM